jgi:hypothetical protein
MSMMCCCAALQPLCLYTCSCLCTCVCLCLFLFADNSRRAFYKEFRRVVEASDVVIQVSPATQQLASGLHLLLVSMCWLLMW